MKKIVANKLSVFLGIVLGFLTLFFTESSFAQTLNLNQFGIEEGLPQSSIYTMIQDKEGNIWVGTMNGVSKYNGLRFENYDKKNGLAENRVTSSCLDKDGNIWFGHWSGGLTIYNYATQTFAELLPEDLKLYKTINAIFCDKNGVIWIGTDGEGLLKYENKKFTAFTTTNGLRSNYITSIIQNSTGELWIGTSNGMNIFKNKLITDDNRIASKSINSLLIDSKNNIWVGTADLGVFKFDNKTKKLINYTVSNGLANNHVKVVFESNAGAIFIGTYGGGVSKYLPQLEAANYGNSYFQTISSTHGLSNDRVLSIIQDRENNIWIGTFLNLNQYFDEQFEIFGENEGLPNSLIWSIIQDKKKNLWIGTEDGLVEFIRNNPENSSYSNLKTVKDRYQFNRKTGKPGLVTNTCALYEDAKGFIWFSNFGQGVSRFNPSTGATKEYNRKTGLPSNDIYSINGDNQGNVWLGTNKGGLLRFNLATEKFDQFTKKDGLGSDEVYTIYVDSKKRIWLGSLAGDLTVFDFQSADGKYNFKTFGAKDGYDNKFTISITEDPAGNMWFGSYDNGLFKYDGKSFKNYNTKDGLKSNTPFLLVCDNNNNLWIGSGIGIDKFNLKDESIKHYEREDGFLGIEINPNAVCKDSDGNLWFGSIIGLVKYNASKEKTNTTEPITSIKNPRIFFEKAEMPEDKVYSWRQNHFTFDFIGASLTNPKRVKYRYMLEGLDTAWSPIVKENSVTYPSLAAGNYTFKVRSCNNDGVWNKEPVTFSFSINPPFWKTTWFYILLVIFIFTCFYLYVKYKERKLRLANQILEQKVVERTEEVVRQKTEIEKKNTVIMDSIEYAKNIQNAILPTQDYISKLVKNYFILYRPKDIVSGDFYWVDEDDSKVFIAVSDCTGHGVPGAFVSLMGHNLLNETLNEKANLKPNEILERLNKKILNALNQQSGDRSAKYGMDMVLITIDKKMSTLEYSGAHNPLIVCRKGEMIELKGNKFSIGSHVKQDDLGFTNHVFQLEKDDMLYMFSDGYTDQKGGPENKKFFSRPFRDLLLDVSKQTIEQQRKVLDDTIVNWMSTASAEQTDDILVVGIKIS